MMPFLHISPKNLTKLQTFPGLLDYSNVVVIFRFQGNSASSKNDTNTACTVAPLGSQEQKSKEDAEPQPQIS